MTTPKIAVVGSINADLFIRMDRLPGRGETVSGGEPAWFPGGKGANQAVAAGRLGGDVTMVGAVGTDEPGSNMLTSLMASNVDVSSVARVDAPTSIALVMVEESGENQIVVAAGANQHVTFTDGYLAAFDVVLCQLEIPMEQVIHAAETCEGLFVLNAAPVVELPEKVRNRVDVLVVNEHEFAAYGQPDKGLVVVTSGSADVVAYQDGVEIARATPPRVEAIDTVGAGDTFVGALVVALASGQEIEGALSWACAAAALSTQKQGAQSGMPTSLELVAFINGLA